MGLTLSESKKEEVMSNYSRIAWRTVHRYRKTKRLTREDMQDLHQECMVKLIEHMNKCETEDELTSNASSFCSGVPSAMRFCCNCS